MADYLLLAAQLLAHMKAEDIELQNSHILSSDNHSQL
jgi:hypothetical protein